MSCCGGGGSGGGGGGGFIGISDLGYLEKSTTTETIVAGVAAMKTSYEGLDQKSVGADQNENCKQCNSPDCSCK